MGLQLQRGTSLSCRGRVAAGMVSVVTSLSNLEPQAGSRENDLEMTQGVKLSKPASRDFLPLIKVPLPKPPPNSTVNCGATAPILELMRTFSSHDNMTLPIGMVYIKHFWYCCYCGSKNQSLGAYLSVYYKNDALYLFACFLCDKIWRYSSSMIPEPLTSRWVWGYPVGHSCLPLQCLGVRKRSKYYFDSCGVDKFLLDP